LQREEEDQRAGSGVRGWNVEVEDCTLGGGDLGKIAVAESGCWFGRIDTNDQVRELIWTVKIGRAGLVVIWWWRRGG